jgi:hypothetical protein
MRTSILAMLAAFGTLAAIPATAQTAQEKAGAQQQMGVDQQMQRDADKGVKTRNSGESGYVTDQEKPGASAHPPGEPDTTTGSSRGMSRSPAPGAGEKSR